LTIEKLEQAKALQEKIEDLKTRLKRLKDREHYFGNYYINDGYNTILSLEKISSQIITTIYQLLKSDLETQIADLEKQLEEL